MGSKIIVIPFERIPRHKNEVEELSTALKQFTLKDEDFPPLPKPASGRTIPSASTGKSTSLKLSASKWKRFRFFPAPLDCYSNAARIPCWFFEMLPLEIRRDIYRIAMEDMGYLHFPLMLRDTIKRGTNGFLPSFLPLFCLTSKAVRDETIPVYLRNVPQVTVSAYPQNQFLGKFLNTVQDQHAWKALKALEFNYFAFFPGTEGMKNADLELVVQCPGLEKLKITMHLTQLCAQVADALDEDGEPLTWRSGAKSVEELVEWYRFERLFECDNLSQIDWRGWSYSGHEFGGPGALEDLAEWIKDEFSRRKAQSVEQQVSWYVHRGYDY
ncbi:hypothetical protein BDV96DRAFT_650580 [Lophiotrema nucula]|uniref:Uncharacterized protein n=1 Tax=Lophiotrema nucula TaxID=690887 RepID=A0A6A5YVG7_9PLEO|nr:hypothetical protein BDV96DRAFT_650580 [Lophiotrema nucula]